MVELRIEDLMEIYALRQLLEERAARQALVSLDDDGLERAEIAAGDCARRRDRGRGGRA